MSYVFDTNHCIYLMNGWNTPDDKRFPKERNTISTFHRLQSDVVYMSEASVGESVYGVERSQRKASTQL